METTATPRLGSRTRARILYRRAQSRWHRYSPFGGRPRTRRALRERWKDPAFRARIYRAMADLDERRASGTLPEPMTPEQLQDYLRIAELRAEVAATADT